VTVFGVIAVLGGLAALTGPFFPAVQRHSTRPRDVVAAE